jgi:integral membrane protein (TIGR01906 family)
MAVFLLASSKDAMRKYFLKSCAVTMGCLAGVWIITAVLAAIDFAGFWTVFHKIFFRNDLWLLNPSTDFLIRMMPQRFFVGMVTHIVKGFFITYAAVLATCILGHVVANKGKGKVSR